MDTNSSSSTQRVSDSISNSENYDKISCRLNEAEERAENYMEILLIQLDSLWDKSRDIISAVLV